jgi:hypothetical protein
VIAELLFHYPHLPALIAPHAADLVRGANAEIEVRQQLDEDLGSARQFLAAAPEAGRRPIFSLHHESDDLVHLLPRVALRRVLQHRDPILARVGRRDLVAGQPDDQTDAHNRKYMPHCRAPSSAAKVLANCWLVSRRR